MGEQSLSAVSLALCLTLICGKGGGYCLVHDGLTKHGLYSSSMIITSIN